MKQEIEKFVITRELSEETGYPPGIEWSIVSDKIHLNHKEDGPADLQLTEYSYYWWALNGSHFAVQPDDPEDWPNTKQYKMIMKLYDNNGVKI